MEDQRKKDSYPGLDEDQKNRWVMDRRKFLKSIGATYLATLVSPLDLLAMDPLMLPLPDAPAGTAAVGIARGSSIGTVVRTAIDLAGGLGDIQWGDRVVIKPNITVSGTQYPARVYTHPEVLRAVIRAVKERTSRYKITVAEASAFRLPTVILAGEAGILAVCLQEGVNFVGWENCWYTRVASGHFNFIDYSFRVPSSLVNGTYDHFINVPVLKNHELVPGTNVDYTCCIKNHVGVMHPIDRLFGADVNVMDILTGRQSLVNLGIHSASLGEIVAELNLAVPRHTMNVVDALSPVLTGGPASQTMIDAEANLILASRDRVVCDSLAVAVLKYYALQKGVDRPYVNKSVWSQAQIVHARQLNLGRAAAGIVINHSGVDDLSGILAQWV